ncbi:MAG: hypothetical protein P8Y37_05560, partial [Anaerolineales bacterium]
MKPKQTFTLLEARQELAKQSNQRFWDLLETSNRTSTEDEELLLAAYASIYLWKEVGTAVHTQRGYWLVARAYISLQQADDAISWAEKCLKITEKNPEEMEDFDRLRAQGVTDDEIMQILLVAAMSRYTNTLSDALQIDVDPAIIETLDGLR